MHQTSGARDYYVVSYEFESLFSCNEPAGKVECKLASMADATACKLACKGHASECKLAQCQCECMQTRECKARKHPRVASRMLHLSGAVCGAFIYMSVHAWFDAVHIFWFSTRVCRISCG